MKKSWPLILTFLLTAPSAVRAVWAQHEVASPANVQKYAESALKVIQTDEGKVQITAPAIASNHKGFYLILCKERLPADQLDLRMQLSSWKRYLELQEQLKKVENAKPLSGVFDFMDNIESIRPLPAGEAVVLDAKAALRAYVVWDHVIIFEKGAMIMDGGLWLTYDLPAFVEALSATPPPAPETP